MKRMLSQGMPTSGDVNSQQPFGFSSASAVGADYGGKPNVNALMRPTLHNSVPESMVNSTASVPLFVRPFAHGWEKGYSEGDLLFVEKNTKHGLQQHHNCVANLAVLNHILESTVVEDKSNPNTKIRKYSSVEEVLKHWNYFGILNNDMDTGSKWQRLLNINVRGRSRVARLWKPPQKIGHLTKGECLFLGFFPVGGEKGQTLGRHCLKPDGRKYISNNKGNYIQVKACLSCTGETMDLENDIKKAHYVIPIGIVSQVTLKSPSTHTIRLGHYCTETSKSLERIEILMRI